MIFFQSLKVKVSAGRLCPSSWLHLAIERCLKHLEEHDPQRLNNLGLELDCLGHRKFTQASEASEIMWPQKECFWLLPLHPIGSYGASVLMCKCFLSLSVCVCVSVSNETPGWSPLFALLCPAVPCPAVTGNQLLAQRNRVLVCASFSRVWILIEGAVLIRAVLYQCIVP